ncbi:MAG: glycosyltransferase, partial [Leptolinea sp.]
IKWIARRILYLYQKIMLCYVNGNCDAIFCHYPDAVDCFRREGFKGPIYMQTQVGVNANMFTPDQSLRKEIREKYNLGDSFVFGSATRFTPDKGLGDIIEALPKDGNWKYLMIGSGLPEEEEVINKQIIAKGLQEKIILTGYINRSKMPAYWNALDCAIHVPRTTENWVETFSLAVVQAMATGKPIIGNTSGSVPYQIGPDGIIVKEGNIQALQDKISWVIENPEHAMLIGEKMMYRALKCFSVQHLNEMFYNTIIDIYNDTFNSINHDMTSCCLQPK